MKIKSITTEEDYEAALKRLEIIFDAPENSLEGDELEALGILIEQYEDEHFPIELVESTLSMEQKKMLEMSEDDLNAGRVINQEDLDKSDLGWLKKKNANKK